MTDHIKLYLDEDTISRALINGLRARNVDILTAQEADTLGASDEEQLAFATSQQRAILTFNTRDFVQLHTRTLEQDRSHGGIIVSDQVQVGIILRRVLALLDARSAEEMQDWLEFLSTWR